MDADIIRQLAELERLLFPELKRKWIDLFGTEPPGYNRIFLIKRLSYRIQELAYGGVRPETRAKLDAILDAEGYDEFGRAGSKPAPKLPGDGLVPGTVLVRHYQGQRHSVTVLAEGFEYRGKPYRSLTAIAREIAGVQWNGPAFFGLRGKGKTTVRRRGDDGR